ncbi:MAG: transglutaminase domain-containing protein [Bacteroidales bacterium]|nr:transglutaminase domain-containing protein [Candidatus Colimorpha pelethequi]
MKNSLLRRTSNYRFALLSMVLLLLVGCNRNPHFITDKQYRNQVHADFVARQDLAQGRAEALFAGMDTLCLRDREALEFLYAYMPYSDLADYDGAFFLKQVQYAFAARDTFSWGEEIPEDIFRHFVLVYRVNNENLDTARMLMFRELKDRVKDLSMEQAALEVNHWCHEYVAYRAADIRTSAPLATMRTSLGRCGEESTFTVTAMRAVGIPARQCYTPRWAHCDDNHAWVEVWVDGEWKFLGACEPDPELNMGWFSVPSTRCMMVHSKAFGRYHGDEEVVEQTPLYSDLNLLSHYAPTRRVTVTVLDNMEKPVADAAVKFKLYNYSEYYTLASVNTDAEGKASLTTGLGDLLIWATDGKEYGYSKLDVRQDSLITICLTRTSENEYVEELDIVPPVAGEAKVTPTEEAVAKNAQRIAHEDSIRNAYTATFPTEDNYRQLLPKEWYWRGADFSDSQVWEIVQKSEGNYAEIAKFFDVWGGQGRAFEHIYDYLKSYSDKDLRDITAEVLEAHMTGFDWADRQKGTCYGADYTYDVYKQGILPARISNEMVRAWRQPLHEAFANIQGDKGYQQLRDWTLQHIAVDDTGNYYNCPISPVGVYQLRHADAHSRDIFFVAACRSLNIPAYLDNATNIIYVWNQDVNDWQKVSFDTQLNNSTTQQLNNSTTSLTLTYRGKNPEVPVYWPHFALAKYENGDFVTFDFEGDDRLAKFPATLQLEPGYYCLFTGNRYPEGDVLSRMEFFTLKEGENRSLEIILRPLVEKNAQSNAVINPDLEVFGTTLADYAGAAGMLYINLGDYREPSKHLVKELQEQRKALQQWGGMIYLLAPDNVNVLAWNLPNADILSTKNLDPFGALLLKTINPSQSKPDYPFVALVNNRGEILFHSQGYKIGLAEQILKASKK